MPRRLKFQPGVKLEDIDERVRAEYAAASKGDDDSKAAAGAAKAMAAAIGVQLS